MEKVGEVTKTGVKICEFEWKIPDFFSFSEGVRLWISPTFAFAGEFWCLGIYPNGCIEYDSEGYIDIYLGRGSSDCPNLLNVSFGIKTLNGEKYQERSYTHMIVHEGFEIYQAFCCLSRNELLERQSELLTSDALTVLCTLKYLKTAKTKRHISTTKCFSRTEFFTPEINISSHENEHLKDEVLLSSMENWYEHESITARTEAESFLPDSSIVPYNDKILHDFKEMFNKKEDCDVIIKVKENKFSAHKVILKARSPAFAAKFQDNTTSFLEIEDCEPSSFYDFLYFIYCGDVSKVSIENVFNLFNVSVRYDVQDLREKCVEFLEENLSIDIFCDTLSLALRHSEDELIKLTTDYFTRNASEVVLTDKWQVFLTENPLESNKLLIKLLTTGRK